MKETFIKDLTEAYQGDKAEVDALVKRLEDSGFFTAPCSGSYHLACEGGLLQHSLNVENIAINIANLLGYTNLSSVAISALLHDVGKAGQFGKPNYVPNILKSGKQSAAKPYATNSELLSVPHEIRSIQIVSKYINLTEDENFAILHHNGLYGDLKNVIKGNETPLYLIIHFADMWASRVAEI